MYLFLSNTFFFKCSSFCVILNTVKERIDSGFFLHQAEVKKKKEKEDKRRKEEDKSKNASTELGAMFETDSFENESNFSSNSSDEYFIYPQKKKRG